MKIFIAALMFAIVAGIGSASADWRLGQQPTMEEREQFENYHVRRGANEATKGRDGLRASSRDAFGRIPATQPPLHPDFYDYERSNGRS